ncbi:MAG: cereblon family protein [Ketobacteraceae bacterium]|nr:cereblon family protein [Ketobacteraceae bacterium]
MLPIPSATPPLPRFLDIADEDPLVRILTGIKSDGDEEKQSGILCKVCDHLITQPEELITINDKFIHCFTNPAGITYEIQCYKQAPGTLVSGKPTDFFSWFPGYLWQYSYCKNCDSHLGWFFSGEEKSFHGLNIAMLKGEI